MHNRNFADCLHRAVDFLSRVNRPVQVLDRANERLEKLEALKRLQTVRAQIVVQRSVRVELSDKPAFGGRAVIARSGGDNAQNVSMRNHLRFEDFKLVAPTLVVPRLEFLDGDELAVPQSAIDGAVQTGT